MIPYHAYVLRLWSEDRADGHASLRVALLDPRSGHRIGFGSLTALVQYLEGVAGSEEPAAADGTVTDGAADA